MKKNFFTCCLLMLLSFSVNSVYAQNRVVISKQMMRLYVISSNSDTLLVAPVGCGVNYGDKTQEGDKKTPEGNFSVCQIQDSSTWTHDFKDGYGVRNGAYGPWFIRLEVPGFKGIGIHGTCIPASIGTRCSEGCIRLHNSDLVKLKNYVSVGTKCTILPD